MLEVKEKHWIPPASVDTWAHLSNPAPAQSHVAVFPFPAVRRGVIFESGPHRRYAFVTPIESGLMLRGTVLWSSLSLIRPFTSLGISHMSNGNSTAEACFEMSGVRYTELELYQDSACAMISHRIIWHKKSENSTP
ncbi:uncharacterized protein CLUP02_03454 [Colletotrichum lupini]|uniref:Uncharacterized protein n=1 Tax=Colletotrichum lupini TaxID=145971 RepID=A0A9Q8SJD1_9PEZI|nr:uncharacterized protein CLUP02_03454 [Colletotrichum lupini]UQC77981.1 hypothetical protein CLUP02_03454 [Colletotrichum lupini]